MSVIIGKEERESYLLGWLTQVPRKGWSKEELDLSVGPFFRSWRLGFLFRLEMEFRPSLSSAMLLVLSSYSDDSSVIRSS